MNNASDQRKKSRSRAFRNPMRLADEHAAMVELLRDLQSPHVLEVGDPSRERVDALLAEVDKP